MKKLLMILFLSAITFSNLDSKAPKVAWSKSYGGIENDRTYNICETSDGGFLTCGQSNSFTSNYKSWLVKMDAKGDTLWTRIIGDVTYPEQLKSMEQTSDGGYIVCGGRMAADFNLHPYLMKLNPNGDFEWGKIITLSKAAETAIWAFQTPDKGYIVAVWAKAPYQDGFGLYKTNEFGNVTDSAFYDWKYSEVLHSIALTHDGGYVVSGITNSFASSTEFDEIFLLKINNNLDSTWLKLYATGDSLDERLGHLSRTSDDGFILVGAQGEYYGAQNDHNVLIIKTDKDGNEIWEKIYGGPQHDVGFYAVELQNSDFIVCGNSSLKNVTGGFDAYVLRLNSRGDTLWTAFYGTPGFDELTRIKPLKSGGYILAGTTYYYSVDPNKTDLYFIRLTDDATDIENENNSNLVSEESITISPNPFSESTVICYQLPVAGNVKIDIYNSLGDKITTLVDEWQEAGRQSCELRVRNYELSQGMYFYRIQIGERFESGKLLLIK